MRYNRLIPPLMAHLNQSEAFMAKRRIYKKPRGGGAIAITARKLDEILLSSNGKLTSRQYEDLRNMELVDSPVRDAIHELKTYSLPTLAQRFDIRVLGRGKRVFARLDSKDDTWYHFSLAYVPRALNNRDVNDAVVRMFFIGKWRVNKRTLWAEPEDIMHYGNDFDEIIL